MAEQSGDRYPPSITAARLYERTSAKGNTYMTGRLGGLKAVIIKTKEADDQGHPIWELKFSAAPASKPREQFAPASDFQAPHPHQPAISSGSGLGSRDDDVIPF